ncbi:MAG TPA: hypothetical protein VML75_22930 [Kofleriaceae bacterium]|nr:hypothetical protein [Kofleriaceae bacterium]
MGLTARQREIVAALGDAFFPSIAEDDPAGSEILPERFERFFETLTAEQQKGLGTALVLVQLAAIPLRGRRFTRLSPESRESYLIGWRTSRMTVRKLVYRGLRDTLAMLYYQDERTWPSIGYVGPQVEAAS